MKFIAHSSLAATAALALAAASVAFAQNATTTPVGVVTIDLPRGSDTYVSTPLAKPAKFTGQVSSRSGFTISVNPSPSFGNFTATPHYVQATNGSQAGIIFDVASNTGSSITLANNGIEPTGFEPGTNFKVVEYWTLGTLFPASSANVSFTPSASTTGPARRTQILFPNVTGSGINRSFSENYFFSGGFWRSTAAISVNADNTPILPDSFIIVRNPASAADGLKLSVSGSVNTDPMAVQLDRLVSGANDNYVSMHLPVDTALNDLGLISSGAFTKSTGTTGVARRDQLLVFNNADIRINKPAAKIYYYLDNGITQGWRTTSNSTADVGNDTIPAGSGLIIRKYQASPATSQFWTKTLNVPN
jgi:uncharacterized protein (TIGR02597 family)